MVEPHAGQISAEFHQENSPPPLFCGGAPVVVTAINYADGKNAAFTYDEAGNLVQMDGWNGKTTFVLDLLDRITSFNDHNGKTVAYTYDGVDNQTFIAYPHGTTVSKEYDLLGQLTGVTDGDGEKTAYSYDQYGNNVQIVYPNNWAEETTFDTEGRELKVEDVDPFNNNKRSKKYEYSYDANGNLTCEYKRAVGASQASITLNYTYDALNRLTSAKEPPSYWGNSDDCGACDLFYFFLNNRVLIAAINPGYTSQTKS